MNRKKRASTEAPIYPICDVDGCNQAGEYKAPRVRGGDGRSYYHFCLQHIREFNKNYNFFEGMSDDAVQAFMKDAVTGHRPTWMMGQNPHLLEAEMEAKLHTFLYDSPIPPVRSTVPEAVAQALSVLNLSHPVEIDLIKTTYKKLAKQYHPDMSKDDTSSAIFCNITASYNVLMEYYKAI